MTEKEDKVYQANQKSPGGEGLKRNKKRPSGETIFKRIMFLFGLVSIVIMIFSFDVDWGQLRKILFNTWWLPVVPTHGFSPPYSLPHVYSPASFATAASVLLPITTARYTSSSSTVRKAASSTHRHNNKRYTIPPHGKVISSGKLS